MKTKFIWAWGMLCLLGACRNDRKGSEKKQPRIQKVDTNLVRNDFLSHFNILDSIAHANINDTVYVGGTASIQFMEVNTAIDAHSQGTLIGKVTFSQEDLNNWHAWFNKKYK
jgi:hypothetical protein